MYKLKFSLLTAAVLLAGALISWCAVQRVIAPKTGETVSVGTLSVPSVLGQTAEEVLFYPWSLYENQRELSRIFDSDYYAGDPEQLEFDISIKNIPTVLDAFQLFGVDYNYEEMWESLLWNKGNAGLFTYGTSDTLIFLKDFSAQLQGVSVFADFAADAFDGSDSHAISYLIHPAQAVELTQAQQDEALERVKADLLNMLRRDCALSGEKYGMELEVPEATPASQNEAESGDISFSFTKENQLDDLLVDFQMYYEYLETTNYDMGFWAIYEALRCLQENASDIFFFWEELSSSGTDVSQASLEELLAALENYGCTVQLVSTPQQVILLFNLNNGLILGVYYDIQLECYSGLGVQYLQH